MEKNEELIEQRAQKMRDILLTAKEWGQYTVAALLLVSFLFVVGVICVGLWQTGMGYVVIGAAVILVVVTGWRMLDTWSYNELEKARHRRYMEQAEERG